MCVSGTGSCRLIVLQSRCSYFRTLCVCVSGHIYSVPDVHIYFSGPSFCPQTCRRGGGGQFLPPCLQSFIWANRTNLQHLFREWVSLHCSSALISLVQHNYFLYILVLPSGALMPRLQARSPGTAPWNDSCPAHKHLYRKHLECDALPLIVLLHRMKVGPNQTQDLAISAWGYFHLHHWSPVYSCWSLGRISLGCCIFSHKVSPFINNLQS